MVERHHRVGVLMGGLSAERDISLQSGGAVAEALRSRGWEVVEIDVGRDLPQRLMNERIDVAWVALHGRFGEDGCVQGLLEVMGIPYTDSGVRASAVAMDKIATKYVLRGIPGVLLARDAVVRRGDPLPDLPLPVITKPSVGGSTLGMTLCRTPDDLQRGIDEALRLHEEVLVEELVDGDEITVAVLDGTALPVVRIMPESGFFDFEAKYTKGRTRYEVPARISDEATRKAQAAAVAAARALGCRGLCRVDFIVRHTDDEPVFLEVNTIPGMTATSLSPMAAAAVGIGFEELVERVLLGATCMEPEVFPGA